MPLTLPREGSRERQVLDLICTGISNKQIGHELGISPRTVEIHRKKAMRRIGATSGTHAVALIYAATIDDLNEQLDRARALQCHCELGGQE
ncbi:MAG: helix-turn-helix transcriptional regulator [Pseudomonadota bacterium]